MALAYNVRFKKLNPSGKVLVEKEGEVVFDRKYLRLKGKGANDHGETIDFTDMKEIHVGENNFVFSTFDKELFELCNFSDSLENFLTDFYRVKNEFFAENLFMRVGMLVAQFDCNIEIVNSLGKSFSKGRASMQIYESSILFLPKHSDAFAINLNFMRHHQFMDDEYLLQIETDSGTKINISRLGSHFGEAQEVLEKCLEQMYQKVLNNLNQIFTGFSVATLLKLAYAVKDGKAVEIAALKKIDAALPQKVMELALAGNDDLYKKIQFLRSLDKEEKLLLGFTMEEDKSAREVRMKSWFLCALPSLNVIAMGVANSPNDRRVFFFRIVMEQGDPTDKLEAKLLEINQCMVMFGYDLGPLLKDKNELRKTKYRVAILRMAFLRLFRKSLLGYSQASDLEKFKDDTNRYLTLAKAAPIMPSRRRRIFRPAFKRSSPKFIGGSGEKMLK